MIGVQALVALVVGWTATWAVRVISLRTGILDRPNARSLHSQPTPTLGGLGLIVGTWAGLGAGYLMGSPIVHGWALAGSTGVLLVLAYDEIRAMHWVAKLAVQAAACTVLLFSGVVLHRVMLPLVGELELGVLSYPLTFVWLVGLQNLYNFMDGMDAFSGLEGLLVAGLVGGLAMSFAFNLAPLALTLAASALGFLFWNRPPARVFMGDAGAHFLGLMFGVLAVLGEEVGVPFRLVVCFLGAFLFDSVYTIFRRLFRGENLTQAHRFHLYQRLNALGWSQGQIGLLYGTGTMLLGTSGYLEQYGQHGLAQVVFLVTALGMLSGTVCLERVWRTGGLEAEREV